MKKQKLTKKQKLALYKEARQADKEKKARYSVLAKYLSENTVVSISSYNKYMMHDCILMPKEYEKHDALQQQMRMLHGNDTLLVYRPGRFTFSPASFFYYMKNTNPHLIGVLPPAIRDLYLEGMIDFSLSEEGDFGSIGDNAVFNIVLK